MRQDQDDDRPGLGRRELFGALTAVGALAAGAAQASPVAPGGVDLRLHGRPLHVVDLTHELTSAFNMSAGRPRIAMQAIEGSGAAVGMNLNLLSLVEHTGTHIDVPRHFAGDGASLGEVPIGDLVVPLAVIDIRDKVARDRNAAVTPDDIARWERRHGRLPTGCCVAAYAGWDPLAERRRAAALPPGEAR
ncbi:MAG: cyclase family protein, partial [Phenylobacterium sp.]